MTEPDSDQLSVMQCTDCGYWIAPAKERCPSCWSLSVHSQPVSGDATLFAATSLMVDGRLVWVGVAELVEQERLRVLAEFDLPGDCDISAALDSPVQFSSFRRESSAEIPVFVKQAAR